MAITEKERNEVAEGIRNDDVFWSVLKKDIDTYRNYLADLIEPEERTCEMYRDEIGIWHCKSCENCGDNTTGSNGELDMWYDSWHPNFCPNCGCKVIN